MINLPTPTLNLTAFYGIADNLSQEDAERVVEAFPDMFKGALDFGPAKEPTPKDEPAGPRVAKVRPAKSEAPIDKGHVRELCLLYVREHPASKAEDVAAALHAPPYDREAFGKAVKAALESLVDSKALSCEGERRGRKYTIMTPRVDPQEAAE